MHNVMYKTFDIMNQIKGFTVGYAAHENKLLFEVDGKRYIAEFRMIDNPSPDIRDDMRRIKYL